MLYEKDVESLVINTGEGFMKNRDLRIIVFAMVIFLAVGAFGLAGCAKTEPPAPVGEIAIETGEDGGDVFTKAAWGPSEAAEGYFAEIRLASFENGADDGSPDDGAERAPIATLDTDEPAAVFSGLSFGEVYTVTVMAYTLDNKGKKVLSEPVSADAVTAPAAVKGLRLTASGDGEEPFIKASWDKAEGADCYILELEPAGDNADPVETTETEETFFNLEYATEYKISVRSLLRYGGVTATSAPAEAEAVTGVPAIESPALTAEGVSISAIKLQWEPADGATGYIIRWGGHEDHMDEILYEAGADETEYVHTLTDRNDHIGGIVAYYTIAAKYGDHEYAPSEILRAASVRVNPTAPPPPSDVPLDTPPPRPPMPEIKEVWP